MCEEEGFHNYTSYVRGKRIPCDTATINYFLGIEDQFWDRPCQHALLANEIIDYEEIERIVCISRGGFVKN